VPQLLKERAIHDHEAARHGREVLEDRQRFSARVIRHSHEGPFARAIAWLELRGRKDKGEQIDSANVRKHVNDVVRLSQLLTAETNIPLSGRVLEDMRRFIETAAADQSVQPKTLGNATGLEDILGRIAGAYKL